MGQWTCFFVYVGCWLFVVACSVFVCDERLVAKAQRTPDDCSFSGVTIQWSLINTTKHTTFDACLIISLLLQVCHVFV